MKMLFSLRHALTLCHVINPLAIQAYNNLHILYCCSASTDLLPQDSLVKQALIPVLKLIFANEN